MDRNPHCCTSNLISSIPALKGQRVPLQQSCSMSCDGEITLPLPVSPVVEVRSRSKPDLGVSHELRARMDLSPVLLELWGNSESAGSRKR